MDRNSPLSDLRREFVATSSRSVPVAGMIFWGVIAVAARYVTPNQLSSMVLFGSGMIFPLGVLLDRLTGRTMVFGTRGNPVILLFLQCIGLVALMWPLVIFAARLANSATLIVLGGAILMGIIWIPFGWAADDPVGLQHAIGRSILCYAAYLFTPAPYKATAISIAVLLSYLYTLLRMKKLEPAGAPATPIHKPQPLQPEAFDHHLAPAGQRHWAWMWILYTGFLFIQPILDPNRSVWIATLIAFALFLGIFSAYLRAAAAGKPLRFWLIAATLALGLVSFPWNQGASTFFVYAASFLPFAIRSVRRVLLLFVAESLLILAEGYLIDSHFPRTSYFHIGWPNTIIAIFLVFIIGGGNILFAEQKRSESKLRLANEEIEQLAALAERERIARDLHDVLGHTLSVIVLKAELAGRLLADTPARDSARAIREIADVERTARTALTEVREAIGGYRAKGLPAEFELARDTLAAAGVALSCESPIPRLAPAEETVLALAVREAVTNIVRHARATHCRMTFQTTPEGFHSLSVEDDGTGILSAEGNGLRGMKERVQSLGGRLRIASAPNTPTPGTTLTIELPTVSPVPRSCTTA